MAPILALLVASATGLTGTATTPTGRLLAMHRRASPPVALAAREARLHGIARRAALQGNDDDAQKAYELAISRWGSGRSFLLAALLQSRLGLEEQTRETFRRGICLHPKDASLIQAWGLFESKHGEVQRALRLVRRAVVLDPGLSGVLRWRLFREAADAAAAARRAPRTLVPQMSLASNAFAEEASPAPNPGDSTAAYTKPAVKYTIPQMNLGWRGRPEFGEDPKSWYDAEGKRNGPPMNYWRQAMDERVHRNSMAALDAMVAGQRDDEGLRALERRMSLKNPLRNRKLLGSWAVLVANGEVIAAPAADGFAVRCVLRVQRAGERRTMTHRYGVFDEHMDEGEELALELCAANAPDADDTPVAQMCATQVNERRALAPLTLPGDGDALHIGGVSLMNDYMYIARAPDGALREVFMRIDAPEDAPEDGEQASEQ